MTVRAAILTDVPALVEMGRRFRALTAYASLVTENVEQMAVTATWLIEHEDGAIFVTERRGGELTGMIGLRACLHPMSGELTIGEVFWWSDLPGDGMRLFERAKQWARENGAHTLQMTQPASEVRLGTIYERLGGEKAETTWIFALTPEVAVA
jgi:hypothetical protein